MNQKTWYPALGRTVLVALLLMGTVAQAGSIFKEARANSTGLFDDFKAKQVGDVVTILIVESNSASESSQVDTQKEHDFDFSLTNLFGAGSKLFPGAEGDTLTAGKFKGSNDFGGKAETKNSGRVTAQLAGVVKEVLPNGNLLIEGRRTIFMNKEQKNIILTGIVRPKDIDSSNTVRSTFIADAAITFEGFGEVTTHSQPGWLSRLLSWIPLF